MTVTMLSTAVLRQMAREREAMLRATPLLVDGRSRRRVRRWIGRQMVRFGSRLAGEPTTMKPVRAR